MKIDMQSYSVLSCKIKGVHCTHFQRYQFLNMHRFLDSSLLWSKPEEIRQLWIISCHISVFIHQQYRKWIWNNFNELVAEFLIPSEHNILVSKRNALQFMFLRRNASRIFNLKCHECQKWIHHCISRNHLSNIRE